MINPCPFCGSKTVKIRTRNLTRSDREYQGNRIKHYVRCGRCYARGSLASSAEEATELWNIAHMSGETILHMRDCNRVYTPKQPEVVKEAQVHYMYGDPIENYL